MDIFKLFSKTSIYAISHIPNEIITKDHEKLKDLSNVPINIELRGSKTRGGCYFKGDDIGKVFGLRKIDFNKFKQCNTHYIYFLDSNNDNNKKKLWVSLLTQQRKDRVFFLTYMGVLMLLYIQGIDHNVERFQEWINNLFSKNTGKDTIMIKSFNSNYDHNQNTINTLKKSTKPISCIYLFQIGTVGELRDFVSLDKFTDDSNLVYKFGMTGDLSRRMSEHLRTYGKMKGGNFKLTLFSNIDALYMCKAENKLKRYMQNMKILVEDRKYIELIVSDKKNFIFIKEIYEDIVSMYSGYNNDIMNMNTILETDFLHQIEKKNQEMELMKYRHVIATQKLDIDYMYNKL
tara:strand:- start:691 stop:1728 length:1038 start_codon:yes stop_codon:yes gene_type:complete